MAKFLFQAKTSSGQLQSGQMEAGDEVELRMKLKTKGLVPLKVFQVGGKTEAKLSFFQRRVDSLDLKIFTRQFATLIDAGIPILDSLKILGGGKRNPLLKETVQKIIHAIQGGRRLGDALAAFPQVFDRLYVNMVKAGETAGILDNILNRMAQYLERSEKLKKQVQGALVYPLVILVVSGIVITGILVFIIPKFQELYKQSNKELPALTQTVVAMSHFMMHQWYLVVGVLIGLPYGIKKFYQSPSGKDILDRVFLKAPIFGELVQKASLARMSRTLSTLLGAGVSMIDSIEIAARTSGNRVVEEALLRCKESVTVGKPFTTPLIKEKVIPDMVTQMVSIGEQSGTMDSMLAKIADFYEDDVENVVKTVTTLIEPLMMVFLGGIIAFLIIAMYLPIFDMGNIQGG